MHPCICVWYRFCVFQWPCMKTHLCKLEHALNSMHTVVMQKKHTRTSMSLTCSIVADVLTDCKMYITHSSSCLRDFVHSFCGECLRTSTMFVFRNTLLQAHWLCYTQGTSISNEGDVRGGPQLTRTLNILQYGLSDGTSQCTAAAQL